jgi:hypothetical protein
MFRALIMSVLAIALGCSGSRWAKEDPDYAAKYPRHTDNVAKMAKQAVDARHVAGKGGPYAGLSGAGDPFAMGGEAGWFHYPTSYLEWHGGVAGLLYEGNTSGSVGVTGGARVQVPARFAPFAGIGAYGGVTPYNLHDNDGIDNDGNGLVDEVGEETRDAVLAIYPEAGVHFWLTPEWRMTASTSYWVAVTDKVDGFWMWNLSLARLTDPGGPTSQLGLATAARERGWEPGDGANLAEYDAMQVEIPATVDSGVDAAESPGGVGTSAAVE